jgi:hypothetical protein
MPGHGPRDYSRSSFTLLRALGWVLITSRADRSPAPLPPAKKSIKNKVFNNMELRSNVRTSLRWEHQVLSQSHSYALFQAEGGKDGAWKKLNRLNLLTRALRHNVTFTCVSLTFPVAGRSPVIYESSRPYVTETQSSCASARAPNTGKDPLGFARKELYKERAGVRLKCRASWGGNFDRSCCLLSE